MIMKTKYFSVFILTAFLAVLFFSCKKKWDSPPILSVPTGGIKTVDSLRVWIKNNNKLPVKVTTDASIYLTVTADESSGNIYKLVYATDVANKGICVRLLSSGGLYLGDSIRLNMNGSVIDFNSSQLQIDSVNVDKQVVKLKTGVMVAPKLVTISQIDTNMESQLIMINNVEFRTMYQGKTYADVVNQKSTNYTLHECGKTSTVMAYTSSFANFANQIIPAGNGSIIAIAQRYNTSIELIFRSFTELKFTNSACGEIVDSLSESFTTATSGNDLSEKYFAWMKTWYNIPQYGSQLWQAYPKNVAPGTNLYAHFSSYTSSATADTAWLITPPIKYSSTKTLSFQTGAAYWKADQLQVLISTDFNGTNISTATWTDISANFTIASSGSGTFNGSNYVNSGTVLLPPLITGTNNFHIGFRYWGSKPGTTTSDYYIDNINIKN